MLRAAGSEAQGFAENGTLLFLVTKIHLLESMPRLQRRAELACCTARREAIIFGDRCLAFATSDKSPKAFSKDMIAVRCVDRFGIGVHNGGTASKAGAYVGLATAAS